LLAAVLLLLVNAFFVAAEFSLVTVDRSEIDKRADEGEEDSPSGLPPRSSPVFIPTFNRRRR